MGGHIVDQNAVATDVAQRADYILGGQAPTITFLLLQLGIAFADSANLTMKSTGVLLFDVFIQQGGTSHIIGFGAGDGLEAALHGALNNGHAFAPWHLNHPQHTGDDTDVVDIFNCGVVYIVALGAGDDTQSLALGLAYQNQRTLAAHRDRHHHTREQHIAADGQQRHLIGDTILEQQERFVIFGNQRYNFGSWSHVVIGRKFVKF